MDTIATITPDERDRLLTLARSLDQLPPKRSIVSGDDGASGRHGSHGSASGFGHDEAEHTDRRGDTVDPPGSWTDVLSPHGWVDVEEVGGVTHWRRPGKETGISATTNFGGMDLLYVFSTATPFDVGKWYARRAAHAVLNHGDNAPEAALGVAAKGGGPSRAARWPAPLGNAARYGLAGEIVAAIEPHTEADPAAVLIQLLVSVGNVVGRTPHFVAESDRHYPNEYTALIGKTAKGRKGSSWGHIPRLFALAKGPRKAGFLPSGSGVDPLSLNVSSGLSSGEGLIWSVRDEITTGKDKGPGVTDKRLVVLELPSSTTSRRKSRARIPYS